jgi:release factor glutamine methyltransferase
MLKSSLRQIRERFTKEGISPVDAELIAAHVLGVARMELHARSYELSDQQSEEFEELVERRLRGEPVQYITGVAPFRYLEFEVGPGVLIPRPETELLVDAALVEIERIQSAPYWKSGERSSIVDLGAGSGAIAISIASESIRRGLHVTVVAVEREPGAIHWLKRNIARHEVDVRVVEADVKDALQNVKADIVIANPPYIPTGTVLPKEVRDFEPAAALFGGAGGLEIPLQFIQSASRILKPGAFLALEHFETQGQLLAEALSQDYFEIAHFEDLNQRSRWLTARRKG